MRVGQAPAGFVPGPALLQLLREAFASMDGRIDPPSSLSRMGLDELRAKAVAETLILATEGPTLLGCVFADVREDVVYVGKLAVAELARGRGIARALLAEAEALARRHGRPFLELQTRIELVENHITFAALGFETVAHTAHPGYDRPTSLTLRRPVPAEAG